MRYKKSGVPETVLPSMSNSYQQSDSPDYSDDRTDGDLASSSGSSRTFEQEISDSESNKTFDGFDPSDIKTVSKQGKCSLNMVQYGLQRHKRRQVYRCQIKNCKFSGKTLRDLNHHHVDTHNDVKCTGCDK